MNLREMIEALEDLASEHGDATEVRLAQQPRWAFEYSIRGIEAVDLGEPSEEDFDSPEEYDAASKAATHEPVVYIAEGAQLGYLPGCAQDALGWGRR